MAKTDRLTVTVPQAMGPTAASFEIVAIHKRRRPWGLHLELVDDQGRQYDKNYDGDVARQVVRQLNTSNNSLAGKSEERRLLEWLQNNGELGAGAFAQVEDEVPAPAAPAPVVVP